MTLKEAKEILKKEGYFLTKVSSKFKFPELPVWEKKEVIEAKKIVNEHCFAIVMSGKEWDEREARLKKEYEENTKAPGSSENSIKGDLSGNKSIEHCGELIPGPIFIAAEGIKFNRKDNQNTSENPALKESASKFNDALLDEQAKKIDEQNKEITRLLSLVEKKENSISRLYYEKSVLEKENEDLKKGEIPARYFDKALVDEQAEKIKKLEHEKLDILEIASSSKQTISEKEDKIKRLGKEITRLNKAIHKKNMKIEELRKESSRHLRGKIKVFYENVDLEKMLKDKDAVLSDVAEELRLSKIREKSLTELCQKYVKANEELKEKLSNNVVGKINAQALNSAESALAYKEKVIAEKDEVIADFGKELKEKHKKYVWYKGAYEAAKQILNTIADYAAKHPDKKFSDQMVGVDIAEEGSDLTGVIIIKSEK